MECRARLQLIALGGTAVGTGINAPPRFAARAARYLSVRSGLELKPSPNYFESLSSQDTSVELSLRGGQLVIRLLPREPLTLEELLQGVTDENLHGEWDTGPAVGREAW